MRARGAWARGLAFAVLLFALAGPLLVKEKHAPLADVAVIVTDRSQSMSLGKRAAQAEAARAQIKRLLAQQPGLIVRETSVTTTATGENNGTQAFAALNAALADVPQGRVAGAILITDGQVHDAPAPESSVAASAAAGAGGGRARRARPQADRAQCRALRHCRAIGHHAAAGGRSGRQRRDQRRAGHPHRRQAVRHAPGAGGQGHRHPRAGGA